jgi:integrase
LPTHQGIATAFDPERVRAPDQALLPQDRLRSPNYSGHSMRSGYVTSAIEVNAPLRKIAEQTRHASFNMLRVYNRRVDLFREHSGAGFL